MTPSNGDALRRVAFYLSVFVFFTSLMDLFVNRLLFRAGPEVLSHMNFDASSLAMAGRISFTFEQLVLFFMLGLVAVLLVQNANPVLRILGLLFLPQLVSAGVLYFLIPQALGWGLSAVLVLVTAVEVLALVLWSASKREGLSPVRRNVKRLFLVSLGLSFLLPLYYRTSVLIGSVSSTTLPLGIDSYNAGVFMIMITAFLAFAYALVTPAAGFRWNVKSLLLVLGLPTLLVGPILYGLMESFFMTQIFSMVIAMSTDITLSYNMVQAIVFFWWFLLAAFVLLVLKGRKSSSGFPTQQGIGLIFVLSTSFLFNYPTYLLLGTAGVLLLTLPLSGLGPRPGQPSDS